MAVSFKPAELTGQTIERTLRLRKTDLVIDAANRTVRMALTSDEPILHSFNSGKTLAYIVLDHKAESINLERFQASPPMTENHDPDRRLGRFRDPETDGHIFRATGRFSKRPYADEIFGEVQEDQAAGDMTNVSAIVEMQRIADKAEGMKDGIPVIRVTRWMPIEGSIVSAARDIKAAGVGRSQSQPTEPATISRSTTMDPSEITTAETRIEEFTTFAAKFGTTDATKATLTALARSYALEDKPFKELRTAILDHLKKAGETVQSTQLATVTRNVNPAEPDEIANTETRIQQYAGFAEKFGSTDAIKAELGSLARAYALEGKPFKELGTAILERLKKQETQGELAMPDMLTEKERKGYSISRAILADASMRDRQVGGDTQCLELDISQEIERRIDAPGYKPHGGIYVPTSMALRSRQTDIGFILKQPGGKDLLKRAGLDTLTDTKGQEIVFTEPGSFIDLLRKKAMVVQLGATVLAGLQGNVAFPKQIGAGTFSWVAENPGSDVADSNLTLDQVILSPKTGMSSSSYSRQLLRQSVVDIDGLVMSDLAKINALGVDLAALHGLGSSNQPRGIYNTSGIGSVTFGGAIAFGKVVDMETAIAAVDADIGTMAYLTTPNVRGKAKQTLVASAAGSAMIWANGEMNGYRAEATNQISKTLGTGSDHGIVFGVWSELMIGEWGALEIITDPYRLKKQGMIEVTSFLMVDVAPRYPEAFCKGVTLVP